MTHKNMEKSKNDNNVWSLMKVLAILLVVLAHITRMYTENGVLSIGIYPPFFSILTSFIYSFHMPAFFAVSGAVYYINKVERHKYNNQIQFILNKGKRLMLPYFVFSLCWVFPTMYYMGFVDCPLPYICNSYLLGLNSRHLWFLLVLFEIFIIFNVFYNFICKYKFIAFIVLLTLFVFSGLMPAEFQLSGLCGYFVYFFLGFLFVSFSKKSADKTNMKKRIIQLTIVAAIWVLLNCIEHPKEHFVTLFNPVDFLTAVFGILMLFLVSRILGGGVFLANSSMYQTVKENSFGIYLFHPMIIYLCFFLNTKLWDTPYLFSIIVFIVSLVVSLLLTIVLRKKQLGFVIGE